MRQRRCWWTPLQLEPERKRPEFAGIFFQQDCFLRAFNAVDDYEIKAETGARSIDWSDYFMWTFGMASMSFLAPTIARFYLGHGYMQSFEATITERRFTTWVSVLYDSFM